MCRNDKKLLKYELNLPLYGDVKPFEVEPEVIADYNKLLDAYEIEFKEFEEANSTYKDRLDDYDDLMEEYNKAVHQKALMKNDHYGEEVPVPDKPEKPTKPIQPKQPAASPVSAYEMQSVGRVYFNLTKPEPSRWKQIINAKTKKPSNMNVWWELYEKYE